MSTMAGYRVTGMACSHCVSAVRAELSALEGVVGIEVDLRPGGLSTVHVTSAGRLTEAQVAAALEEAGDYHLGAPRAAESGATKH